MLQTRAERNIPKNKSDIVIRDNEKETCMLKHVTISGESDVIKKETEKVLKYTKNLQYKFSACRIRGVSKTSGEWYQKTQKNKRYKQINFIGLQNNRHHSQHTVGNVYKASGNCQQRPL
jgi:hypothetical protein